jgi:methylmalonyl-CoA mutase
MARSSACARWRSRTQNVFEVLMDAVRVCSLGQITHALFEVSGQYRRSM